MDRASRGRKKQLEGRCIVVAIVRETDAGGFEWTRITGKLSKSIPIRINYNERGAVAAWIGAVDPACQEGRGESGGIVAETLVGDTLERGDTVSHLFAGLSESAFTTSRYR